MTLPTAFHLRLQSALGFLTAGLLAPLYFLFMKFRGYRIRDLDKIRHQWASLLKNHWEPCLICGNHLTLIDSIIMIYALVSLGGHIKGFQRLPWNLPERANFQQNLFMVILCYLSKCIPVSRGGDREGDAGDPCQMQLPLGAATGPHGLSRGKAFPIGTRRYENFSYGVGRFLQDHRDCRVLCVYLRGDAQILYGDMPGRGETFTITMDAFLPVIPDGQGLREQRDLAGQIVRRLAQMEEEYFAQHREKPGPD